jgi:hypothetical protein
MFNNALANCSSGGSVYVYPSTYNTSTSLGSIVIWSNWTNIYVLLGAGTIFNCTGAGSWPYQFDLVATGAYAVNFTLTSNGTAYFDGNGFKNGWHFQNVLNCTFSNMTVQNSYGYACQQKWARYCAFENLTFYSFDQNEFDIGFLTNDMQYCTFKNVTIDGNNNALARAGLYLGDWEPAAGWDGNYFNNFSMLWIKNLMRDGIYLNSGATGYGVYNNTFTNCTIENNWGSGYDAIKLRPAQNNTFLDIVVRNWTDAVTTGTCAVAYGESALGNCTGNSVTATIYNTTVTSLILTADGDGQSVDHNFFNLTVSNGKHIYAAQGSNSTIHDNIVYMNFTDCTDAIYLEQGNITHNTFYLNFSRCGSGGHPDIWHVAGWTNITSNTFNVYATSGNANGLMDFTNGTQGNSVIYPYIAGSASATITSVLGVLYVQIYSIAGVPIAQIGKVGGVP